MATVCLALATCCVGAAAVLAWAAVFVSKQSGLDWRATGIHKLRGRWSNAEFPAWLSNASSSGESRQLSVVCPTFARTPEADSNGDCVCPRERPVCYQGGLAWCLRNDGIRDYHFFSMSCETCTCSKDTGPEEIGEATSSSDSCRGDGTGADTRPNKLGACACPSARPLCVTIDGVAETQGCSLGAPDNKIDEHMFAAGCTNCACRHTCPEAASQSFADTFGDCACTPTAPICYENGVKGCQTVEASVVASISYFRATCGSACECRAAVGACEPATCVSSADCVFESCYDCEMCLGISRCPDVGVLNDLPNANGNCICGSGLSCFQGAEELPGCPIAPFGESSTSFRANCRGCKCDHLKTDSVLLGLQCPTFAKDELPDRYGDCVCPGEFGDCWQDEEKWCKRNDGKRDLRYFSVRCTTCECRLSEDAAELARNQPCPEFARNALSDSYRNCACPPDKPLCIEGEWSSEEQLAAGSEKGTDEKGNDRATDTDDGRPGPMCNTTHGWLSSTHFRYNCENCLCMEVEGEGSRLRAIRPDELISYDGDDYMKHHMMVDLRVINSYDTVKDWEEAYTDITTNAITEYARGVEGGLSYLDIAAAAMVEKLETQATRAYTDSELETVHAMRVRLDFGIMWANIERRQMESPANTEKVENWVERILSDVKSIKHVTDLTPRETHLLLNFASIFNEALFAQELELQLWRHLNVTWEQRRVNTTAAEGQVIEAPRVEVTRAVVDDQAMLPELSWIGPLAPELPERRALDRGAGAAEEEGLPIVLLIAASVGGCAGLACLVGCCYCCKQRCRAIRQQRQAAAANRDDKKDSPPATARGESPPGSPVGYTARAMPQEIVHYKGRNSLQRQTTRNENRGSILLGGGSGGGGSARMQSARAKWKMFGGRGQGGGDESPSSQSPRAGSARASGLRQSASPKGRESESPTGRGSDSPTGRASMSPSGRQSASPTGRQSMARRPRTGSGGATRGSTARQKVDRREKKRLGDLAGHKSLSGPARAALEADQERREQGTRGRRISAAANVFGRKSGVPDADDGKKKKKSQGADSPNKDGSNSPGSSESEAGSPNKEEDAPPDAAAIRAAIADAQAANSRCSRLSSCLGSIASSILSVCLLPCHAVGHICRCCCRRKKKGRG